MKDFKTIDQQIDILKSRGLIIDDYQKAYDFLINNNYYRISGYSLTLRKNDVFYETATFGNIMDIYNFDSEFRHIILKHIEQIETRIKSIYAYEFCQMYGPDGYLRSSNFINSLEYLAIMNRVDEQKQKRLSSEAYLKHFVNDLGEDIPFWAYIDLFTFGNFSKLYEISTNDLCEKVASHYNITTTNHKDIISKQLHSLTIIRNLCAHGSRIYNRLFEHKPSLNKKEKKLLIKNGTELDLAHFYGFILIMKRLLLPEQCVEMKNELIELCNNYPFIKMEHYGFREDWKDQI